MLSVLDQGVYYFWRYFFRNCHPLLAPLKNTLHIFTACMPETTFIHVTSKCANCNEQFVSVSWCLYPSTPKEGAITHFYLRVATRDASYERKYYEVDNHRSCNCIHQNPTTTGYEKMQEEFTREINQSIFSSKSNTFGTLGQGKFYKSIYGLFCVMHVDFD